MQMCCLCCVQRLAPVARPKQLQDDTTDIIHEVSLVHKRELM